MYITSVLVDMQNLNYFPFFPQLKTPMTLGQKKAKTIEQLLDELGVRKPTMHAPIYDDVMIT